MGHTRPFDPECFPASSNHSRLSFSSKIVEISSQRLTGLPLASGALSVFGFCGFLRKFCFFRNLRIFAEFCGFFSEFCGFFAEFRGFFAEFLRNLCGILRTNTKGTRAKGHQCEALICRSLAAIRRHPSCRARVTARISVGRPQRGAR